MFIDIIDNIAWLSLKKFEDLEEISMKDFLGKEKQVCEKEDIHSTDGILLESYKGYISGYEGIIKVFRKTKEQTELEEERYEVSEFMKKMACESREDNDWRPIYNAGQVFIIWNVRFQVSVMHSKLSNLFNISYFATKKDAQSCLDKLKEKYGDERLKEIWGIK